MKKILCIISCIIFTWHIGAWSMFMGPAFHRISKYKQKIIFGVIAGLTAAELCAEYNNSTKECLYIDSTNCCLYQKSKPVVSYDHEKHGSATLKHINAYNSENYSTSGKLEIHDILFDNYRDGLFTNYRHLDSLEDIVEDLIAEEIKHASTHYVLYHGTYVLPSLLFRTLMENKAREKRGEDALPFVLLRDPGVNNDLINIDNPEQYVRSFKIVTTIYNNLSRGFSTPHIQKITEVSFHDGIPEVAQKVISANTSALGNTNIYGENSFRFIALNHQGFRKRSGLVIPDAILDKLNDSVYKDKNLELMIKTCEAFGITQDAYMPYVDELSESKDIGALIQIFIPKQEAEKWLFPAGPYGRPPNIDESIKHLLRDMQMPSSDCDNAKLIDAREVRITLTPTLFEEPRSDIKMNIIAYAHKEKLQKLIRRLPEIVDNLQEE
jgi:hypothetical protein